MQQGITRSGAIVAAGLFAMSQPVAAQNYVYDIDNSEVAGTPLEQPHPSFPGRGIRTGQEGWVRLNFVISPDGRALDPIIIDSVGGVEFERSARDALAEWTFEPAGEPLIDNTADIRFEHYRGRDMATSNFLRRYRRIMVHLTNDEVTDARSQVDNAQNLGGWNLYESTMLSLMLGRVAAAEGDLDGKLEYYRRALAMSNANALAGDDLCELLVKLFELQVDHGHYAAARETLDFMRKQPGSDKAIAQLGDAIAKLALQADGASLLRARATVYNPCDCESGTPVWAHRPSRRTFSFASLSGNVERFEVRCKHDRLQGDVDVEGRWTLPADAASCRVFVFGDDGASFEFVEHGDT